MSHNPPWQQLPVSAGAASMASSPLQAAGYTSVAHSSPFQLHSYTEALPLPSSAATVPSSRGYLTTTSLAPAQPREGLALDKGGTPVAPIAPVAPVAAELSLSEKKVVRAFAHYEGAKSRRIYVGNINFQATEAELYALFARFGAVEFVEIVRDRSNRSKGFGFITFERQESAGAAIEQVNGAVYRDRALKVNRASEPIVTQLKPTGKPVAKPRQGPPTTISIPPHKDMEALALSGPPATSPMHGNSSHGLSPHTPIAVSTAPSTWTHAEQHSPSSTNTTSPTPSVHSSLPDGPSRPALTSMTAAPQAATAPQQSTAAATLAPPEAYETNSETQHSNLEHRVKDLRSFGKQIWEQGRGHPPLADPPMPPFPAPSRPFDTPSYFTTVPISYTDAPTYYPERQGQNAQQQLLVHALEHSPYAAYSTPGPPLPPPTLQSSYPRTMPAPTLAGQYASLGTASLPSTTPTVSTAPTPSLPPNPYLWHGTLSASPADVGTDALWAATTSTSEGLHDSDLQFLSLLDDPPMPSISHMPPPSLSSHSHMSELERSYVQAMLATAGARQQPSQTGPISSTAPHIPGPTRHLRAAGGASAPGWAAAPHAFTLPPSNPASHTPMLGLMGGIAGGHFVDPTPGLPPPPGYMVPQPSYATRIPHTPPMPRHTSSMHTMLTYGGGAPTSTAYPPGFPIGSTGDRRQRRGPHTQHRHRHHASGAPASGTRHNAPQRR